MHQKLAWYSANIVTPELTQIHWVPTHARHAQLDLFPAGRAALDASHARKENILIMRDTIFVKNARVVKPQDHPDSPAVRCALLARGELTSTVIHAGVVSFPKREYVLHALVASFNPTAKQPHAIVANLVGSVAIRVQPHVRSAL